MDAILLDSAHKKQAAAVYARAFMDYPQLTCYFPNPDRRRRYLPWYMGLVLSCALRYGTVYTTPDIAGVACFMPPEHIKMTVWEYLLNGFSVAPIVWGFQSYRGVLDCEEYTEKAHKVIMGPSPHYYLWGLAVDPSRQRQGIGAALMEPGLAKADLEKLPVYLETHDQKNLAYYQKWDFDLVKAERVPRYNLPFWCMLRQPH